MGVAGIEIYVAEISVFVDIEGLHDFEFIEITLTTKASLRRKLAFVVYNP